MVRKEGQVVNVTGNDVGMDRHKFMQLWWVKWHSHSTRRIKGGCSCVVGGRDVWEGDKHHTCVCVREGCVGGREPQSSNVCV